MQDNIFILSIRVYPKNEPAIVVARKNKAPGTPVKFFAYGKDYYGEVVSSLPTSEGSDLHRWLASVSGESVTIVSSVLGPKERAADAALHRDT